MLEKVPCSNTFNIRPKSFDVCLFGSASMLPFTFEIQPTFCLLLGNKYLLCFHTHTPLLSALQPSYLG